MLREQTAFGQSLAYQPVAQDSLAYGSALPAYEQRQLPDYYSAALAQRAAGTAGTAGNGRATQPSPAGEAVVPVAHFAGGPLYVAQGDWLAAAQPAAMVVNGHALAQAEGLHEATLPDLLAAGAVAGNWAPVQADPQPDHGCQTGGPCACGGTCGGKCGGKDAKSAGGCGCGNNGTAAHGVSAGNPWPLDDARHNLVLLAQELLLLEGHLADPERRCPSCVTKHALTVRGLADEGRRLDSGGQLGPVWQQASTVALGGDLQAVRGVRQGVVHELSRAGLGAKRTSHGASWSAGAGFLAHQVNPASYDHDPMDLPHAGRNVVRDLDRMLRVASLGLDAALTRLQQPLPPSAYDELRQALAESGVHPHPSLTTTE